MRDHKGKPSAEHEAGYRALSEELRRQLRQPDGSVRGPAVLVRRLAAAIEALAAAGEWTREELTAAADYLRRDLAEAARLLEQEGGEWRASPTWLSLERGFWHWLLELTDRTACEWHELASELRHGGHYRAGEVVGIGQLRCQRCGHVSIYEHPQPLLACSGCGGEHFSREPLAP